VTADIAEAYFHGQGLPRFWERYRARAQDLTVVLWGDSLLAREQHTTVGDLDPTALPPTFHSRKLDWHLWQCLDYPRPRYYRFDHPGCFRFRGRWDQAQDDPAWDDTGYRPGLTAFSSDPEAACFWTLPADDAHAACGLLYRTDATGAEVELRVASGPGRALAWDERRADWVEAHGFRFSQRHVQTGPRSGNTGYPRRLDLRRAPGYEGQVSFALQRTGAECGRLLLWGAECWDPRQGVLRVINSARGSHTLEMLVRSMDSEVWAHRPDLVVLELPLLNMVHQHPCVDYSVRWVWDVVWGDRPGAENDWALRRGGPEAPDVLLVIPHHSRPHFAPDGGFADLGGTDAREIYQAVRELIRRRGDVPMLDMAAIFLAEISADPRFPGPYQAMAGSSPDGLTYTTDDVHQNDRGTAIYARHLCQALLGEGCAS
jgi:hypothetical protein